MSASDAPAPTSCGCNVVAITRSPSLAAPISPTRSSAARVAEQEPPGETPQMTRSVARLLAESLEAHDVDQVFCVPGESYVGLINAMSDMNSIRLIVCRHEGGAGF